MTDHRVSKYVYIKADGIARAGTAILPNDLSSPPGFSAFVLLDLNCSV